MPPVVGAFAGIAALIGVSATQLAIGILATAARIGLSYYEARKAKKAASKQDNNIEQNIRQAAAPRYTVLGLGRVGGVVWFWESLNGKMYLATILSNDIIDGYDALYVNNVECNLDGSGYVTTPPFNTKSGKLVRVDLKYGYTDQTASSILTTAFPSIVTSQHTAAGVAYLVAEIAQPKKSADFQTVYGSGIPPVSALVRGVLAYDPRDDDQDYEDATTWLTTKNPALLFLYYLTATNGMGLSRSLFDGDIFKTTADFCDQLIATKTKGNRKRYEMGGVYYYDQDPADIANEILDTFGGRIFVTPAGLFGLSCDELDEPEITITEDMVIEIEAKRFTGALYEYTTIKTKFTSEDHGYIEANEEADPWVDNSTMDRIGREIPYTFDLPYVFRHDQCRRLMKRKFFELNPEWTVDLLLDFNGIELFGERVFRFIFQPLGIDMKFRVEGLEPDSDLGLARISVKATSINAAAFAWNATLEEGTAPAIPPSTTETAAPQTPTGVTVLIGDTGSNVRALVSWVALTTGKTQEAQYKLSASSTWTDLTVDSDDRAVTLNSLTSGSTYDFRVRVVDPNYGVSNYATLSFTATAIVGTTGALQSFAASGGVLVANCAAQQAANAAAAYVEFTGVAHGAGVSWAGSVTVPALASINASAALTQIAGSRDIYARSVGINGDTGAVSGPVNVTVTSQISTGGSGGSGSGSGGGGINNGGNGGNVSHGGGVSPSQDDSGGGTGGGGGGGGIY